MNRFTAIDPNGTVHTRNSKERTYTHTVVGRYSATQHVLYAKSLAARKAHRSNFDYYLGFVDGTSQFLIRRSYETEESHLERTQKKILSAETHLEGIRDRNEWVEMRVQRDLENIQTRRKNGYYEVYHNLGWCGSLRLAQKLKTTSENRKWADVTILVSEQK